jgi:hypothetical protein
MIAKQRVAAIPFDIDRGASNALPARQISAQQNDLPTTRSEAAERMRRHRERRRDGLRCLTIELRETEIDALLIGKKDVARNDQDAIRDALYAHLERTLG